MFQQPISDYNQLYEYLIARRHDCLWLRLTWLVSKPVSDKLYLQTCSKYAFNSFEYYSF